MKIDITKKRVTRGVSLLTLVFFLFSQIALAVPNVGIESAMNGETPSFLRIDIPTELASLDEIWEAPPVADPRVVLHIQDAHANYGAQKKIQQLLGYLNKTYAIKTIFVEGAVEDLNPDFLKLFPDKARNLELADLLAQQGELAGAELFILEEDNKYGVRGAEYGGNANNGREDPVRDTQDALLVKAHGIETAELYRSNYEALKKVFGAETLVNRYIRGYESRLEALSSKVFTNDLRRILAGWQKFEKGHREFMPFVRSLAGEAKRLLNLDMESLFSQVEWPQITRLIVLQEMEKDLETEKALREKDQLISFLKAKGVSGRILAEVENFREQRLSVRQGEGTMMQPRDVLEALIKEAGPKGFYFRDYPAFSLYAGYLILKSELDAKGLFEEIKVLFGKILDSLAVTPIQKGLLELYRDEELARKLLRLELSRRDWQQVLLRKTEIEMDSLISRLKTLSAAVTRELKLAPSDLEVKTLSQKFRDEVSELYAAAFNFYEFARQREAVFYDKINEVMNRDSLNKAVLITGGFHTDGMTDLFREHNVSYGILTPRLMEKSDEKMYRGTMLQKEEQLFTISNLALATFASRAALGKQGVNFEKKLSRLIAAYRSLLPEGFATGAAVAEAFNKTGSARAFNVELVFDAEASKGGKDTYRVKVRGTDLGIQAPVALTVTKAPAATETPTIKRAEVRRPDLQADLTKGSQASSLAVVKRRAGAFGLAASVLSKSASLVTIVAASFAGGLTTLVLSSKLLGALPSALRSHFYFLDFLISVPALITGFVITLVSLTVVVSVIYRIFIFPGKPLFRGIYAENSSAILDLLRRGDLVEKSMGNVTFWEVVKHFGGKKSPSLKSFTTQKDWANAYTTYSPYFDHGDPAWKTTERELVTRYFKPDARYKIVMKPSEAATFIENLEAEGKTIQGQIGLLEEVRDLSPGKLGPLYIFPLGNHIEIPVKKGVTPEEITWVEVFIEKSGNDSLGLNTSFLDLRGKGYELVRDSEGKILSISRIRLLGKPVTVHSDSEEYAAVVTELLSFARAELREKGRVTTIDESTPPGIIAEGLELRATSWSSIKPVLMEAAKRGLLTHLYIDIDNTLVTPRGFHNTEKQIKQMLRGMLSHRTMTEARKAVYPRTGEEEIRMAGDGFFRTAGDLDTVFLQDLRKMGVRVVALTARPKTIKGQTMPMLNAAGIHVGKELDDAHFNEMFDAIIYTGSPGRDKARRMAEDAQASGCKDLRKTVFIDDQTKNTGVMNRLGEVVSGAPTVTAIQLDVANANNEDISRVDYMNNARKAAVQADWGTAYWNLINAFEQSQAGEEEVAVLKLAGELLPAERAARFTQWVEQTREFLRVNQLSKEYLMAAQPDPFGLREEFESLLGKIRGKVALSPQEEVDLRETFELSMAAHRNQNRKGDTRPYFVHLLDVTTRFLENFGAVDPEIFTLICQVSLLHDAREDQPEFYDQIRTIFFEEVDTMFRGRDFVNLLQLGVRLLTKIEAEPVLGADGKTVIEWKIRYSGENEEPVERTFPTKADADDAAQIQYLTQMVNVRKYFHKEGRGEKYSAYSEEFIRMIQQIKLSDRIANLNDMFSLFTGTREAAEGFKNFPEKTFRKTLEFFIPYLIEAGRPGSPIAAENRVDAKDREVFYREMLAALYRYATLDFGQYPQSKPLKEAAQRALWRLSHEERFAPFNIIRDFATPEMKTSIETFRSETAMLSGEKEGASAARAESRFEELLMRILPQITDQIFKDHILSSNEISEVEAELSGAKSVNKDPERPYARLYQSITDSAASTMIRERIRIENFGKAEVVRIMKAVMKDVRNTEMAQAAARVESLGLAGNETIVDLVSTRVGLKGDALRGMIRAVLALNANKIKILSKIKSKPWEAAVADYIAEEIIARSADGSTQNYGRAFIEDRLRRSRERPHIILLTGRPGAGKSTAINELSRQGFEMYDPAVHGSLENYIKAVDRPILSTDDFKEEHIRKKYGARYAEAQSLFLAWEAFKGQVARDGKKMPSSWEPDTVLNWILENYPGKEDLWRRVNEKFNPEGQGDYRSRWTLFFTNEEIDQAMEEAMKEFRDAIGYLSTRGRSFVVESSGGNQQERSIYTSLAAEQNDIFRIHFSISKMTSLERTMNRSKLLDNLSGGLNKKGIIDYLKHWFPEKTNEDLTDLARRQGIVLDVNPGMMDRQSASAFVRAAVDERFKKAQRKITDDMVRGNIARTNELFEEAGLPGMSASPELIAKITEKVLAGESQMTRAGPLRSDVRDKQDKEFRKALADQGFVMAEGENTSMQPAGELEVPESPRSDAQPLFIDVSPDFTRNYYDVPAGITAQEFSKQIDAGSVEPFLTIPRAEQGENMAHQLLITPSIHSKSIIMKGKTPEEQAKIEAMLDWDGTYGKRAVRYGAAGQSEKMIVTWDKDVDQGVWSDMIDTLLLQQNLYEQGLLDPNTDRSFRTVMEIGTGGGRLAALLSQIPGVRDLYYTDISPYALRSAKRLIRQNKRLGASFREHAIGGAGFATIRGPVGTDGKFDLIIVNPPYIPIPDFLKTQETENNPYGGTGLIREIIANAARKLNDKNPDAQIILHVSSMTKPDLEKYMREYGQDLVMEPFGAPLEVPLKIDKMSEEWKKWFSDRGLITKHENAHERGMENYSHTIQAYRIKLKPPSVDTGTKRAELRQADARSDTRLTPPAVIEVRADELGGENWELAKKMIESIRHNTETVICLSGGASRMSEEAKQKLMKLFDALAILSRDYLVTVVDGGTKAGIMEAAGRARQETGAAFELVGVSPAVRGDTPLDENHSLHIKVSNPRWVEDQVLKGLQPGQGQYGIETETMMREVLARLSRNRASVGIAANGGSITLDEVREEIAQRRSTILIKGSGRAADVIAEIVEKVRTGEAVKPRTGDDETTRLWNKALEAGVQDYPGLFEIFDLDDGPESLALFVQAFLRGRFPKQAYRKEMTDEEIDRFMTIVALEGYFQPLNNVRNQAALREFFRRVINKNGFQIFRPGEMIIGPYQGKHAGNDHRGDGRYHLMVSGEARLISMQGHAEYYTGNVGILIRNAIGQVIKRLRRVREGPTFTRGAGFAAGTAWDGRDHWGEIMATTAVQTFSLTREQFAELVSLVIEDQFEQGKIKPAEGGEITAAEMESLVKEGVLLEGFETAGKIYRIRSAKEVKKMSKKASAENQAIHSSRLAKYDYVFNSGGKWYAVKSEIATAINVSSNYQYVIQGSGNSQKWNLQFGDPDNPGRPANPAFKMPNTPYLIAAQSMEQVTGPVLAEGQVMAEYSASMMPPYDIYVADQVLVPQMDANGQPVLNEKGKPVMVVAPGAERTTVTLTVSEAGRIRTLEPVSVRPVGKDGAPQDWDGVIDSVAILHKAYPGGSKGIKIESISVSCPAVWKLHRLDTKKYMARLEQAPGYSIDDLINEVQNQGYSISEADRVRLEKLLRDGIRRHEESSEATYTDLPQDFRRELFELVMRWVIYDKMPKIGTDSNPIDLDEIEILIDQYLETGGKRTGIPDYQDVRKGLEAKYKGRFGEKYDERKLKRVWNILHAADPSGDWQSEKLHMILNMTEAARQETVVGGFAVSRVDIAAPPATLAAINNEFIVPDVHEGLQELLDWAIASGLTDRNGDLIDRPGAKEIALGDLINRYVGPDGMAVLELILKWHRQALAFNREKHYKGKDEMKVRVTLGNHELDILRWSAEDARRNADGLGFNVNDVRARLFEMIEDGVLVAAHYEGEDPDNGIQYVHAGLFPSVRKKLFQAMARRIEAGEISAADFPLNKAGVIAYMNHLLKESIPIPGLSPEDRKKLLEEMARRIEAGEISAADYPLNRSGVIKYMNGLSQESTFKRNGGRAFNGTESCDFGLGENGGFIFDKSKRRNYSGTGPDQSGAIEGDIGPWGGNDLFFELVELGIFKPEFKDMNKQQLREALKGKTLKDLMPKGMTRKRAQAIVAEEFGVQIVGHSFDSSDVQQVRPMSMIGLIFPNIIITDAGRRQSQDPFPENRSTGLVFRNGVLYKVNALKRPLKKEEMLDEEWRALRMVDANVWNGKYLEDTADLVGSVKEPPEVVGFADADIASAQALADTYDTLQQSLAPDSFISKIPSRDLQILAREGKMQEVHGEVSVGTRDYVIALSGNYLVSVDGKISESQGPGLLLRADISTENRPVSLTGEGRLIVIAGDNPVLANNPSLLNTLQRLIPDISFSARAEMRMEPRVEVTEKKLGATEKKLEASAIAADIHPAALKIVEETTFKDVPAAKADKEGMSVELRVAFLVHGILELFKTDSEEAARQMNALANALGAEAMIKVLEALPENSAIPSTSETGDIVLLATSSEDLAMIKIMLALNSGIRYKVGVPDNDQALATEMMDGVMKWSNALKQKGIDVKIENRFRAFTARNLKRQVGGTIRTTTAVGVRQSDRAQFGDLLERMSVWVMPVIFDYDGETPDGQEGARDAAAHSGLLRYAQRINDKSYKFLSDLTPELKPESLLKDIPFRPDEKGSLRATQASLRPVLKQIAQDLRAIMQTAIAA